MKALSLWAKCGWFCCCFFLVFWHSRGKSLCPAAAAKLLQSCPPLCNPIDGSPPGSSVHGILQARILEWVAIPFSRRFSQARDRTQVSCTGRWILYHLSHEGIQHYKVNTNRKVTQVKKWSVVTNPRGSLACPLPTTPLYSSNHLRCSLRCSHCLAFPKLGNTSFILL